jgi:hypothetical protein
MALVFDGTALGKKKQFDKEAITVSTTAIGGTAAKIQHQVSSGSPVGYRATAAILQVTSANPLYLTFDGTTPSATNGINLATGDTMYIYGYQNISSLRMVRNGASDSAVNILYFAD